MSEEFLPWENEVCIPLLVLTVFSLVSERAQVHRNLLQNSPQKTSFKASSQGPIATTIIFYRYKRVEWYSVYIFTWCDGVNIAIGIDHNELVLNAFIAIATVMEK